MKTYYVQTVGGENGNSKIVAESYSIVGLVSARKFAKKSLEVATAKVARIYSHGDEKLVREVWE